MMVMLSVSMLTAQTWEFDSDLAEWETGTVVANKCTSTWVDGAMKID